MQIGIKIPPHTLRIAYQHVKTGRPSGYHHVKNVLNHVDNAIKLGKHVYRAVEHLINKYAENHHRANNDNVMKGLSGYESMRNKVIDANDHVQQITGHLKNNLPQLI